MFDINLPTILIVLILSWCVSIFVLPLLLLKFTSLEWLKIYSTSDASALSTFFTLSGFNVIWLVGTSLTIVYILLTVFNENPPFLIACFTKQKLTSINLGSDLDFNPYQKFFHKWYWYGVDKNLSKLGVISKDRKSILDYNSFSYNSIEEKDFLDVLKCFYEPLWLTNQIWWASKLVYSRTSKGVYSYIESKYPIQPMTLTHQEIGMITFLFCFLNGIVLNDCILKQVWYFNISKILKTGNNNFNLFCLWENNKLRVISDLEFNQIIDSVRIYLNPTQNTNFDLVLTTTSNCSTKLEAICTIDREFFKIN
jgi:hypothetical protein